MKSRVPNDFLAFRVEQRAGGFHRSIERVPLSVLPDHDVLIEVGYSSLNYKDALSASGARGVTRRYPHTPGIDAAGTVVRSSDERFSAGDVVICTGYDLGMDTPGGLGRYVSVPGAWLIEMPAGLDARSAMAFGTAGLTAALALQRLESAGASPAAGPLLVTGASGGVGTMAVHLASQAGYEVVASTGKPSAAALLTDLGASRIEPRPDLSETASRPLLKADVGSAIDTVGGATLSNLLSRASVGGAVAACGNVGGADLSTTVYPFILRGVSLMGVDSQHAGTAARREAWEMLASVWQRSSDLLERAVTQVDLGGVGERLDDLLAGTSVGRVVVDVAADPS